ncbi:hypothetical protein W97_09061 [Coniosporium apollinis CBS 100218]|uniref:Uncharacterized protein n=1 Tax=Coniosporium apollinis (strain CBS 100218) TaxID=1168221 RepID=R7Z6R5_CONA1|nr:uncharacterized protein W97_09061 [Coniosporium apollinis CBS 100218]EON69798.1 hypothetical protein W97_09061 [Coniosporium apollinis CBS 100218]
MAMTNNPSGAREFEPDLSERPAYEPERLPREFSILADLLSNEEVLDVLCTVPEDALSLDQKTALDSIAQHFCSKERAAGGGGGGGGGGGKRKRACRPGAPKRPAPRHPMRAIMNLDALDLDPSVERFLDRHGADAALFLAQAGAIQCTIAQGEAESLGDAFIARYQFAINLDAQLKINNQLWCYTMLLYHDLVKYIRPDGAGRVGKLMRQEIIAFLGPVLIKTPISTSAALENLNNWAIWGRKLNKLSVEFGPGFVFFLAPILSKDFVSEKLTASGRYFDEAILKLRQLDLADKTAKSRANDLGQAIRDHLIKPFAAARAAGVGG